MSNIIKFTHSGDFSKSEKFFNKMKANTFWKNLNSICQKGVQKLKQATPKDTGLTAASWDYNINVTRSSCSIYFTNDNMAGNIPVVILIQYGHGTKGGAYVQGRDFINPAMRSIFDDMATVIWREVTS